LEGYISEAEAGTLPISEKTKAFWKEKKAATDTLLDIMVHADKTSVQLDVAQRSARDDYLENAKTTWEVELNGNLVKLNTDIVGPYSLGIFSACLLFLWR
jgi:23S rRNA G2069 N7-methylase RlmK/C1962 C5-methylase RlmI